VSTDARHWLAARRLQPPKVMASWLEVEPEGAAPVWESLAHAGLASLSRARSAPGRIRESAYHLLRADALLTYACEAAVEMSPDPDGALSRILETVGARQR
jgi:hypothetical protein